LVKSKKKEKMSNKKFVEVCVGIGMNQFFPEYALIEIPNEEVVEVKEKKVRKTKKKEESK
jgi:hypothetical protein